MSQGKLIEKPDQLQEIATTYRQQGMAAQNSGDFASAMKYYQKAIELNPYYAAPYNDLGVIFEASGYSDRAEEAYNTAIGIDPNYLSAYTNLALLYEGKRDLNKAAIYWGKRAQLGDPNDIWTQKAKRRAEDLRVVMSATPIKDAREQEVIGMMNRISEKKTLLNESDTAMAEDSLQKARRYYAKGDLPAAFRAALDAQYLDPKNSEIDDLLKKIQERALSK